MEKRKVSGQLQVATGLVNVKPGQSPCSGQRLMGIADRSNVTCAADLCVVRYDVAVYPDIVVVDVPYLRDGERVVDLEVLGQTYIVTGV